MNIIAVNEVLSEHGLEPPELNVLAPTQSNYEAMLFQPNGHLEVAETGVRHADANQANLEFSSFLSDSKSKNVDIAATPEYSMPWKTLEKCLMGGVQPAQNALWILGCEGIKLSELEELKGRLASNAMLLFEPLEDDPNRFLNAVAYVFSTKETESGSSKLVVLLQFKTTPMGDPGHFEVNGMLRGTKLYVFGTNGGLRLATLICSDAFAFEDSDANDLYDRTLLLHIQLNKKPRQDQFRKYREKIMQYAGEQTELICLNWARNVQIRVADSTVQWGNIAASAWYLRPSTFDDKDATLTQNHRLGLYYTWLNALRCHALFFNYDPAVFRLTATKVAHIGVVASLSKRRGPQLNETCTWDDAEKGWSSVQALDDEFSGSAVECGDSKTCVTSLATDNPFRVERLLALSAGAIGVGPDWHKLQSLDSCSIDATEQVRRITVCQDPESHAFRVQRLRRCGALHSILKASLPPAIGDLGTGFQLDWSPTAPHQNVISQEGRRATAIYLSDAHNEEQAKTVAQIVSDTVSRWFREPDDIVEARQRLFVWYRDQHGQDVLVTPHPSVNFDDGRTDSPVDFGRNE